MRKINFDSYEGKGVDPKGNIIKAPYDMRGTIVNFLFNRKLNLNPIGLLKQDELAKKIAASNGDLLLEEEEYQRIKRSVEAFEGLSQNEVELCKRVLEAEEVKVAEQSK